ncbi:polyphosphate polymerase domain-containing protein [Flavobacterium sp.]|uniref:polyphosphate polymerase domain-containing protein n=1 Tax=Flavobacterium sp. TaxID=239 RepID=UPI003751B9A3
MIQNFIQSIKPLKSISLQELDSVSLQDRIDKKFVLSSEQLRLILPCLKENYSVLDIDGNRVFSYENNYFDTKDFQFYKDHHNSYLHRIKVRSRKYVESDLSFFEIKKKEKVDRTNKFREKVTHLMSEIDNAQKEVIQSYTRKNIDGITLILKNNFKRITLVNHQHTERVTIDLELQFIQDNKTIPLEKVVIIEIKQSKMTQTSPLANFFKSNNIRKNSFSKYIYGVLIFNTEIKNNNFLSLIKKIKSI